MMRARIVSDLMNEYAARRVEAERQAAVTRERVEQRVPLYANFGAHLSRVVAECAANGVDAAEKVRAFRERAEGELRAAGFSPEDLAPRYRCEKCGDTGYVGEPVKQFCDCFQKRLREEIIARSGLGDVLAHSFDRFDLNVFPDDGERSQREVMRRVQAYAREWADAFPGVVRRDIVLSGPTGVGKTFLLDCVAARAALRGYTALKVTAFRMLEAMRLRHFGRDDDDLMGVMLSVDILYIDDLGTEPLLENISVEYLFTILNERQQAGRSTLVATNLRPAELRARYTERITSRLLNAETGALFLLEGQDVRMRVRQD